MGTGYVRCQIEGRIQEETGQEELQKNRDIDEEAWLLDDSHTSGYVKAKRMRRN